MIVFGPNRKRAWKLGSIKVQEKRQTMFLGRLMAANKIQGTRSQIKSVVDRANRAQVMLTWAGCYEDNRSLPPPDFIREPDRKYPHRWIDHDPDDGDREGRSLSGQI